MSAAFGVYVHIPFCESRCDYCDFATWTDRAHLVEAYIDACVRDIERRDLPEATSVFFGGGTPSLLAPHDLARVLDAVPTACDAEVTVECNPDSVDGPKLRGYASAGVNRVSIGVQSLRVEVLAASGRTHDPANVARAVDAVFAAGIERLNLDLIYGTPGERVADWEHTLRAALALEPTHVSAYALTVESGTPLGRQVAAGRGRRLTTTTRRRSTSSPTTSSQRRASTGTRSPTGAARATSAGTTCSPGRKGTTRASAARPTVTGTAGGRGTCVPRSATWRRWPTAVGWRRGTKS